MRRGESGKRGGGRGQRPPLGWAARSRGDIAGGAEEDEGAPRAPGRGGAAAGAPSEVGRPRSGARHLCRPRRRLPAGGAGWSPAASEPSPAAAARTCCPAGDAGLLASAFGLALFPPRSLPGWPDPGEEVGEAAGTTPSVALALVLVRRARLGPGARCGPPRPRGPAERSGPLRPRTAHCRPQGRAAARSLRHVGLRELPWGLSLGKRVLPVAKVLK